jgi:Transposase DDE domain
MEMRIVIIFCVVDDILKCTGFKDDWQAKVSSSEIITIAIVAGLFFGGNLTRARKFFIEYKYTKRELSSSQFNRRLLAIDRTIWKYIFQTLAEVFKTNNKSKHYAVDSFPVAVCDNIRISRCNLYKTEEYRGKSASKRRYFYGIKVHMIATTNREPVEVVFSPRSYADCSVFKSFPLGLPSGSSLFADSGFTDYNYEDLVNEALDIDFLVARKSNSKRPHCLFIESLISSGRKTIETTFSQITNLFPKKIHAVTAHGFELKVFCFILAYSFSLL